MWGPEFKPQNYPKQQLHKMKTVQRAIKLCSLTLANNGNPLKRIMEKQNYVSRKTWVEGVMENWKS
jgi:hypothetical protein